MLGLELKDFQRDCIDDLLENIKSRKEIILKSPTGSGKTIILINFIEEYLKENPSTTFVWLSTGQGNLEEQSKKKYEKYINKKNSKLLNDVLLNGFNKQEVAFLNWESITSKRNIAIKEAERKNLYDRIKEAKNSGIEFRIIIDEEHLNKTEKSDKLLSFFNAESIIRVSATPKISNKTVKLIEIDEADVIEAGLMTKNLYINLEVNDDIEVDSEIKSLIELAIKKHQEIREKYLDLKLDINPLIVIQFPNSKKEKIIEVEKILDEIGFNYKNKRVAKWMAEEKINIEDITDLNSQSIFLLMKQAISTGWDCPRAKILVKLRDHMEESFEIQTIGRIRRTINAKFYEDDVLDSCYLYTFDREFINDVVQEYNGVESKLLILKDEHKDFKLIKEIKIGHNDKTSSLEVLKIIRKYLIEKYNLISDKKSNILKLQNAEYDFRNTIVKNIAQGIIVGEVNEKKLEKVHKKDFNLNVDIKTSGLEFKYAIDMLRKEVGLNYHKTKVILERMFLPKKKSYYNTTLVNLKKKEFYAFIINNKELLKRDFREAVSLRYGVEQNLLVDEIEFKIPEKMIAKYYSEFKNVKEIKENVFANYTTDIIRSIPETKFEKYCQDSRNVSWIYKNGEASKEFFSIVYRDGVGKEWNFYPDYILEVNGDIWIIETKGGESVSGQSKNIDKKAHYKFDSLKIYAEKHNLKWGFVRDYDKDNNLYINFEKYSENMMEKEWKLLSSQF